MSRLSGTSIKSAPVESPTLTGDPKAPTPAIGDSSTSIATTEFVAGTVGELVTVESDAAAEILDTTAALVLAGTTADDKVIATESSRAHQRLELVLAAASGGSYTLEVDAGTLTLDAAGEVPVVRRNADNDAWIVISLGGATIAAP